MAWKHDFFGCLANPTLSLVACLLMPLSVGKNAEAVGEKHPILWVIALQIMPCLGGPLLRGEIRKKMNIEGSFYADVLAWLCCPCCALCQEVRETGSLDYLIAPEMQIVVRDSGSAPAAEPAAETTAEA